LKPVDYLIGGVPALVAVCVLAVVKPDALTLPVYIGIGIGGGAIAAIAAQLRKK